MYRKCTNPSIQRQRVRIEYRSQDRVIDGSDTEANEYQLTMMRNDPNDTETL